jgi:hypothetical protein
MLKSILAAAAVLTALSGVARADDMAKTTCDDATFKMMTDSMAKDTDPKMADGVKMAGDQMKMAMDSMKAGKMDDCSKHIGMAMDSMMMKHQ